MGVLELEVFSSPQAWASFLVDVPFPLFPNGPVQEKNCMFFNETDSPAGEPGRAASSQRWP